MATSEEICSLARTKHVHGTWGIDKNCWIRKETTSPHPGKAQVQMVESTTGIRCEVGEHQRCQQDVLKGLSGISVMAADVLGMEAEIMWQKL